ncbi:jg19059 [Pararge aegeria aegeria]|uniref:Jg19059 protein n=1 Tax=Pararge aegeria aegeria TaxID=348720 RepID=A0A8S4SJN9_9NEOP|nr:jg19059 [Pararge aegeria aegeria]
MRLRCCRYTSETPSLNRGIGCNAPHRHITCLAMPCVVVRFTHPAGSLAARAPLAVPPQGALVVHESHLTVTQLGSRGCRQCISSALCSERALNSCEPDRSNTIFI